METRYGTYSVDALWRDRGVGAEADGAELHTSAEDWSEDLVRQNAIHSARVVLLRFPVRRLRRASVRCGQEMRTALRL